MSKKSTLMIELRTKTEGELQAMLREERNALAQLRMNVAVGKESETHKLRKARVAIARIQTVLRMLSSQDTTAQN